VRGLHLYVRPIESGDRENLATFLGTEPPAWGLLGKLLGDLVAVVSLEITEEALRITGIEVASELRRKWIGKAMVREVEQLARKFDRHKIVVELLHDDVNACDAQEFFRRVGFENEGDRWVRNL